MAMKIQPKQIQLYTNPSFIEEDDNLIPSQKAVKSFVHTYTNEIVTGGVQFNNVAYYEVIPAGTTQYDVSHNLNEAVVLTDLYKGGTNGSGGVYTTDKIYANIKIVDRNTVRVTYNGATTVDTVLIIFSVKVTTAGTNGNSGNNNGTATANLVLGSNSNGLSYNSTSGVLELSLASSSGNGALSSTDFKKLQSINNGFVDIPFSNNISLDLSDKLSFDGSITAGSNFNLFIENINNSIEGTIHITKTVAYDLIVNLNSTSGITHRQDEDVLPALVLPGTIANQEYFLEFKAKNSSSGILVYWILKDFELSQQEGFSPYHVMSQAASTYSFSQRLKQGGNDFNSNLILGTTANHDISIIKNNVERLAILTAGIRVTGAGTGTGQTVLFRNSSLATNLEALDNGNLSIGSVGVFGGGVKVVHLANATTVPTGNPSAGILLFSEAGVGKVKRPTGEINTIGIVPDTIVSNTIIGNLTGVDSAPQQFPTLNLYDYNQRAFKYDLDGLNQILVGCIYTQTAIKTINNTNVETDLLNSSSGFVGTKIIPSDTLVAGKNIRISLKGALSTDSTPPSLRIKVVAGNTVLVDTSLTQLDGNITNTLFTLNAEITCVSEGTSGAILAQGYLDYTSAIYNRIDNVNTTYSYLDTYSEQNISVTATWDTPHTNNSISCTNATIEILN